MTAIKKIARLNLPQVQPRVSGLGFTPAQTRAKGCNLWNPSLENSTDTVSETVSESVSGVMKNCDELERIVFDFIGNLLIFTNLNRGFSPSPSSGAIFPNEIEDFDGFRTIPAQFLAGLERPKVRFPKVIQHRRITATIYGKKPDYPFYRLAYYVAGKRVIRHFKTYGEAKAEAERKVREIANGSQAAALSGEQSRDALAALQRLETFRQSTGRRLSLLAAASELVETLEKLQGRSLGEAIEGYLQNAATVTRKDVADAVTEFNEGRKHKGEAKDGKRSQLSRHYLCIVASWLRGFASTFPATALCDLTKDHLNLYFKPLAEFGTKNRNDRRAALKMFFAWAMRQDYLPRNHRLLEAESMAREVVDPVPIDFYRPNELQKLLENAPAHIRPIIALGGLAGLRGEEIMRLDWSEVCRVEGHIELSARIAKTRQRRLVEICPVLAAWLAPYREAVGKIRPNKISYYSVEFRNLRESLKIPTRDNGLRHAFCTYHFALHQNENLVAAQSGNSPAMIHAHYKGLATKADAEKWFAVHPQK